MTNEEIEKAVDDFFDSNQLDNYCADIRYAHEGAAKEELCRVISSLVAQALEEAARQIETKCQSCEHSDPAEVTHHQGVVEHAADVVRALKGSLVQEPASSS